MATQWSGARWPHSVLDHCIQTSSPFVCGGHNLAPAIRRSCHHFQSASASRAYFVKFHNDYRARCSLQVNYNSIQRRVQCSLHMQECGHASEQRTHNMNVCQLMSCTHENSTFRTILFTLSTDRRRHERTLPSKKSVRMLYLAQLFHGNSENHTPQTSLKNMKNKACARTNGRTGEWDRDENKWMERNEIIIYIFFLRWKICSCSILFTRVFNTHLK